MKSLAPSPVSSYNVIEYTIHPRPSQISRNLEPLATDPPIEEIQRRLWLIHRNHMSSTEYLEEGEVAAVLDLPVLVAIIKFDVLDIRLVEILLARPLESFGPGLVTEPVADEISITSVDQDWDLLKDAWYKTVEGLHPVPLEEEVTVDVKVATVVAADFNTELLLNLLLVQVLANPAKGGVAKIAGVFALATDVIDILETCQQGSFIEGLGLHTCPVRWYGPIIALLQ